MPTLDELREAYERENYHEDGAFSYDDMNAFHRKARAYIDALEAERTAQQQRIEKLEAALEPFADDWHWFLDWNKRNPDHPKTHSEFSWLGQIDPVSYDDAFRRAYDLLHADEEDAG